ncbi:hypothetical protein [Epibacterium ulvae]|uniref:hypothetical protein n=1 Tax=Epibacterium ulvae TaxID=1156985 RepID=UPI00249352D6|nr:hypothetical protein [Epibacterium ulvae]
MSNLKDTIGSSKKAGSAPDGAEALFRQTLRSLALLEKDIGNSYVANRILRALLTIGCNLQFSSDVDLILRLQEAELQIDVHDLTLEDPQSGEQGMILPNDNLTLTQHAIVQWLLFFEGKARLNNQHSLEQYIAYMQSEVKSGSKYLLFGSAMFSEFKADKAYLNEQTSDHVPLLNLPLFRVGKPLGTVRTAREGVTKLTESLRTSFWIEWYQGFLDGKPLNWELQRRVALIADPIWEEGPEAVAQEIERIKAEWLAEQLPMAETIELNPETAKFRAVPIPVENASFVSALLDQVEDALEDCLDGHNGLRADMGDARKIKRVLTKYRDDPQNAELTLTRVATNLRKQIYEDQWLPDNTENSALLSSVEDAVRGIRSNHPDVAQNRQAQAALAVQELPEEGRAILEQAVPILTAVSEGAMAYDFAIDIPELINDATTPLPSGAPPLPGVDASTRMFSRVSKIAALTATYENASAKGAKIFDSNLVKSIRLAGLAITTLSGLSAFLYGLVQIGLRLFGVL